MLLIVLEALARAIVIAQGMAGPAEHWIPMSTTASSITGTVMLRADRLTFANGAALQLVKVRDLTFTDDVGVTGPASLFRVLRPADPVLLHGNRICGGTAAVPITFVVIWKTAPMLRGAGSGRGLAAYSGRAQPAPDAKAACATFRYDTQRSFPV